MNNSSPNNSSPKEEHFNSSDSREIDSLESPQQDSSNLQSNFDLKDVASLFDEKLDNMLLEEAQRYVKHWKRVAKKIKNNTNKNFSPSVLRMRYEQLLSERKTCKKGLRFSSEEDNLLLDLGQKFNKNWQKVSDYFPMRDLMSLKNRFFKLQRESKEAHKQKNHEDVQRKNLEESKVELAEVNEKKEDLNVGLNVQQNNFVSVPLSQMQNSILPLQVLQHYQYIGQKLMAAKLAMLPMLKNNVYLAMNNYLPMQGRIF